MTEKRFIIFQDSYDDLYIQDKEVYRATGIKVGNEEDVKYKNVLKIVELLNEFNRLAEANEEQCLAIMTYLHDNYYDIWEEVNKEVFKE